MAMTKDQRNRLFDLRELDDISSLVGWDRHELDRLEDLQREDAHDEAKLKNAQTDEWM